MKINAFGVCLKNLLLCRDRRWEKRGRVGADFNCPLDLDLDLDLAFLPSTEYALSYSHAVISITAGSRQESANG